MISSQSRLATGLSYMRRRSQAAAFFVGLLLSLGGALAWYEQWIGPIRGSLLVGIGASVIAAAIVAYLSPFSESAYRRFISLGIDEVWASRQAIKDRNWVDWLNEAEHKCVLLGIAHGNWCKDGRFFPALRDRLANGVRVEMLFLDPRSAAASQRAREETDKRDTRKTIRESINEVWKFRQGLAPGIRDRLRVYVYDATPSCGLTWVDDFMIVTHYLAGLPNLTSPALMVKPPQIGMERSLYNIYAENVQNIEKLSVEVDDRNIQEILSPGPHNEEGTNPIRKESALVPPGDPASEKKGA